MSHEMFLAEDFIHDTQNIYQAIMVIAKRARQIGEAHRKEMDNYLSSVEMMEKFEEGEDAGMIEDNPVLHEPVLQFEKPTVLALREMLAEKLTVIRPEEKPEEKEDNDFGIPFPPRLDLSMLEEITKDEPDQAEDE